MGVSHNQVDVLHAGCRNLVSGQLAMRFHADGEETEVAETNALAVEDKLLQAVEHVHHHAVYGASAVRRVVRRDVIHELLEVHLSVGHHGGIPEFLTCALKGQKLYKAPCSLISLIKNLMASSRGVKSSWII